MTNSTLLHQQSLLVTGMMCYDYCGTYVKNTLQDLTGLAAILTPEVSIADLEVIVDAEPCGNGKNRLDVYLFAKATAGAAQAAQSSTNNTTLDTATKASVTNHWLAQLSGFKAEPCTTTTANQASFMDHKWFNLGTSLTTLAILGIINMVFPPSLLLTIILSVITFVGTAIAGRKYLAQFFRGLRQRQVEPMPAAISTGLALTNAHMLYHDISMPMVSSGAMAAMNFFMAPALMTCVSGMELLRENINQRQREFVLNNHKTLFPELLAEYQLANFNDGQDFDFTATNAQHQAAIQYRHSTFRPESRKLLRPGQMILIPKNSAFPVDCKLLSHRALIDTTINNGEAESSCTFGDTINGGSINLGEPVYVLAQQNAYDSTLNRLLLRANRNSSNPTAAKTSNNSSVSGFTVVYAVLIILGITAAIVAPYLLGALTVAIALQNLASLFFAICPCTIALAHYLPKLSALAQLLKNKILLRNDHEVTQSSLSKSCHTLVLDKTGTLTMGKSRVESCKIDAATLQQVRLLEQKLGQAHPLGKAIIEFATGHLSRSTLTALSVSHATMDPHHRGISGKVGDDELIIGNAALLQEKQIPFIPEPDSSGLTPVYVAKNGRYTGCLLLACELRPGIAEELRKLKKHGTRLVMITGDTSGAATAFNKQLGNLFTDGDVHANATPGAKEEILKNILQGEQAITQPATTWVVGDGVNDSLMLKRASELGATSASISEQHRAAFFADISLNGSLKFIRKQHELEQYTAAVKQQNRILLLGSSLLTTASLVCISVAGLAMPPLLPLLVMIATIGMVLGNSYRTSLKTDALFAKTTPMTAVPEVSGDPVAPGLAARFLTSHHSFAAASIGVGAIFTGVLAQIVIAGSFAWPSIIFTAGIAAGVSSACILSGGIFLGVLALALLGYTVHKYWQSAPPASTSNTTTAATTASIPQFARSPVILSSQTLRSSAPPLALSSTPRTSARTTPRALHREHHSRAPSTRIRETPSPAQLAHHQTPLPINSLLPLMEHQKNYIQLGGAERIPVSGWFAREGGDSPDNLTMTSSRRFSGIAASSRDFSLSP